MNPFGVTKLPAFGTFGEFNIGANGTALRAKYILTKMRPGTEGNWDNNLATQMVPWREVFNVEELSFDELLQRDLDDSRVAHDLIPYLLGSKGDEAKFFPPILAVVAPRKDSGTGIKTAYPKPVTSGEHNQKESFGDLFDFEQMYWGGTATPLAQLGYNPQRAAFIIVDGQHRAMAILALHRQLNGLWRGSPYASYYDHIEVTPQQVRAIELPVCIIFFPDLYEGSPHLAAGTDLTSVCRDIFLVVNKNAKPVTESRQVLLEDDDLAARLMRRTLSALKGRSSGDYGLSRIYSISYGDSDADMGKQVVSGQTEYSSAIALHKIHAAISFGMPEAFTWNATTDITTGQKTRNPTRPAEILLGTNAQHLPTVSRKSGKALHPAEVREIVERLGDLADDVILALFDGFRPFTIHNYTMRVLKDRLADPNIQADTVQKKCQSLIFEGSGIRSVFDSHVARLRGILDEPDENLKQSQDRIKSQFGFCDAVLKAMGHREREVHRARACDFFQIDQAAFYQGAQQAPPADQITLEEKARRIYQTVSTQAFQLGFVMAVFATVEELKRRNSAANTPLQYDARRELVRFVVKAFLAGLNNYFSPTESTKHRTLNGYIKEPRAAVFDQGAFGLRGLFAMQGGELNERQWHFFRYLCLELVHSTTGWPAAAEAVADAHHGWPAEWYRQALPDLVEGLLADRQKYVLAAVNAHLDDRQFKALLDQRVNFEKGAGKSSEEIDALVQDLQEKRRAEAREITDSHLKASLGAVESREAMTERLLSVFPPVAG